MSTCPGRFADSALSRMHEGCCKCVGGVGRVGGCIPGGSGSLAGGALLVWAARRRFPLGKRPAYFGCSLSSGFDEKCSWMRWLISLFFPPSSMPISLARCLRSIFLQRESGTLNANESPSAPCWVSRSSNSASFSARFWSFFSCSFLAASSSAAACASASAPVRSCA